MKLIVISNYKSLTPDFSGQLWDYSSQTNYNYFRNYNPKTGGYTQHDLIGLNGGMNPFAYVGGNPVSHMDISGLSQIVINVGRNIVTANSTLGSLSINGVMVGDVLELPDNGNRRNESRIPSGSYFASEYYSDKFGWTLRLKGVSGRSNILLHPGNFPKDTKGCLLPGTSRSVDKVNRSRDAMKKIKNFVKRVKAADVFMGDSTDIIFVINNE